jgi:hypothetical protein
MANRSIQTLPRRPFYRTQIHSAPTSYIVWFYVEEERLPNLRCCAFL